MIAEHTTEITFGDTLGPEQKEMYEAELRKMLAEKLGNVADVVFFDHNLRCSTLWKYDDVNDDVNDNDNDNDMSEWTLASRNSPAYW